MLFCSVISILIATTILVENAATASPNHTGSQSAVSTNALNSLAQSNFKQQLLASLILSNNSQLVQQLPFQLLASASSQLASIAQSLSTISQSLQNQNRPQQSESGGVKTITLEKERILMPANNVSSLSPIYTTLPFNDLNLTDFAWIWEDLITSDSGNKSHGGIEHQGKLFGGGRNTTYADLNFLTLPQLFNALGR